MHDLTQGSIPRHIIRMAMLLSKAMEPTSANNGVWVSPATAKPMAAPVGMKIAARSARLAPSPSGSRCRVRSAIRRVSSAGVIMAGS